MIYYFRRFYHYLILYFVFYIKISNIYAQTPYIQQMQYPYQVPTKVIYDILIDKKGILYLGTDKGLFKFDGKSSTAIPFQEARQAHITHLKEDKKGRIWGMNFAKQVFYLHKDTLRSFPTEIEGKYGGLVGFNFTENQIWILTHYKLISYDFYSFKRKFVYDSDVYLSQLDVFENQVFVSTEYKIFIFNEKHQFISRETPTGFEVSFQTKDKNLYCIQRREFKPPFERISLQWKNNKFIELPTIQLPKEVFIHHHVLTGNQFWLCTKQGAYTFNAHTGKTSLIFPDKNVTDVVQDYQGNYWISTLNNGLWFCPSIDNKEFKMPNQFSQPQIISVYGFKDNLYLGTDVGTIIKVNKKDLTQWSEFGKASYAEIKRMAIDEEKGLLAAGLGFFDMQGQNKFNNTLVKDAKFYNYQEKKMLLLATPHGFLLIDVDRNNTLPEIHNFKLDEITSKKSNYAIYQHTLKQRSYSVAVSMELEKFWVGYDDGLIEYDFKGNQRYIYTEDKKSIIAQSLEVDNYGKLWIGTFQQGLFVMDNHKIIKHFAIGKNLKGNHIQKIVPKDSKIWIGTEAEIGYVDAQTLHFTDILAQNGFSSSLSYQDFYPDENLVWIAMPHSIITLKMTTQNQKEELKVLPIYSPKKNTFKIEVLHYKNPSKVQILYRLKGIDKEWHTINETQSLLQFNHLKKGNYTLEVFAKDIVTQIKSPLQTIDFVIEPKWWETWWFYTLVFIFALFFISGVTYLVMYRNQQKQLLKEKLWISQIKALQNQMNPHFLYNILNTVQGLVYSNKPSEAGELLGNFSDLMRNTLQISEKPYISLNEEINLLKLYVDLEKIRFEGDLVCNFIVELDSPYHDYLIPSMFLQPFIENAFKHGLLHKKGEKILNIIFENDHENLIITIDDNGIGRKHAQEIQKRQARKSTGFALNATNQRIELLNKISSYNIKIDILDKYNDKNESVGTKVLIKLNLKNESNNRR